MAVGRLSIIAIIIKKNKKKILTTRKHVGQHPNSNTSVLPPRDEYFFNFSLNNFIILFTAPAN
jgi:hypothetical protein